MSRDASAGRRAFLRSTCGHCLGLAGLAASASGAQEARIELPAARFERPALDTDEGGLWAMMDREERRLRRGPFVIKEPALNAYVRDLVCKLAGDHCPDVRVHVVRTPYFNATMAPNGMMQVWSGLLLRVENEAQLAAVLGHEIGHYLERHTLERLRDTKNRAAFAQFLGIFGLPGAIAGLGVLASAFAFTRDQEQRADRIGMQLMLKAGYEGREAARVWDNLLAELKVRGGDDVGRRSPMMATHPPVENRRDELLRLAGSGGGVVGADEFDQLVAPLRFGWIQEEIHRGQHEESLALFGRMIARRPQDAQALYGRGEVLRLRASGDDLQQAVADLQLASQADAPPPEVFRSLGLVYRKWSQGPQAAAAFEKYLALAPQAADAGLIQTYLSELKP